MFYWIYDFPSLYIGLLFAAVFSLVILSCIFLFRKTMHDWFHAESSANDMLGFAFSSFFVLYGLLLGLLSVAAYQNYSSTSDLVTKEGSSLGALYSDIGGYPEPMRSILKSELRNYSKYVVDVSWEMQQQGESNIQDSYLLSEFSDSLMSFNPTTPAQEIIHAEAFRQTNHYLELRRTRLANITTGIPAVMWWVVVIGAFISLLMIALLKMPLHVHLILGLTLSVFLSIVIFLIAALDNPFRGEVSVTAQPFQEVYDSIMKPDENLQLAMAHLQKISKDLGAVRIQVHDELGGTKQRQLYFGAHLMNDNFALVDEVKDKHGATATLFVKEGEQFIRVSTNVRKDNGARAIGTQLDPNGPAYLALSAGNSYHGKAIILGKAYITAYEPIFDASSQMVGVFYVGYKMSSDKSSSN